MKFNSAPIDYSQVAIRHVSQQRVSENDIMTWNLKKYIFLKFLEPHARILLMVSVYRRIKIMFDFTCVQPCTSDIL